MIETATFGAGCFWGVEATFRRVPGVVDTCVGYAGGETEDPTYRDVCRGDTGHAEVVEVRFDPARVSYERLLEVFFDGHDPTQVDRQGPDVGRQYRSLILTHTPAQEAAARAAVAREEARRGVAVATEIGPAGAFWRAEDYHQRYLERRRARAW